VFLGIFCKSCLYVFDAVDRKTSQSTSVLLWVTLALLGVTPKVGRFSNWVGSNNMESISSIIVCM